MLHRDQSLSPCIRWLCGPSVEAWVQLCFSQVYEKRGHASNLILAIVQLLEWQSANKGSFFVTLSPDTDIVLFFPKRLIWRNFWKSSTWNSGVWMKNSDPCGLICTYAGCGFQLEMFIWIENVYYENYVLSQCFLQYENRAYELTQTRVSIRKFTKLADKLK